MRIALVPVAVMVVALSAAALGADPHPGRNLGATCANCHNTTGNSAAGMPSLAGMSKEAMLKSLKDFKDGNRSATVMQQLARGYSDAQLELIAAYYAAQK